jgi:DNA-binding MarR family transcriptional regulator
MSSPPECVELDRLLVQVAKLHYSRAHTLFETIGLYRGQPPLLRLLAQQEGRSQSELAALLGITPATVSKMLERMQKAGFVVRAPDPKDQRVSRVYLTEHGRIVQGQMHGLLATLAQDTFDGFTPEERALLRRFLQQMHANLVRVTGDTQPF